MWSMLHHEVRPKPISSRQRNATVELGANEEEQIDLTVDCSNIWTSCQESPQVKLQERATPDRYRAGGGGECTCQS